MFDFHVVGGTVARRLIETERPRITEVVRDAYLTHHRGESVNPNSYFLRFPDKPSARIIALPAYLGGSVNLAGLKWIASFPANIERNVPRASAALLLNDYATGYPLACLEASQISSARTAASAVLGAEQLLGSRTAPRIAVVGAGVIARAITDFFAAQGWTIGTVAIHDRDDEYADRLVQHVEGLGYRGERQPRFAAAAEGAQIVVFATTAAEPWVGAADAFAPGQVVLNISLRDIAPELISGAQNVVDDIDHCLTANTSVHLAEQQLGHRKFIDGTLADLILGRIEPATDRPRIFSPFGLGVLDLAVGAWIYRAALDAGTAEAIPGFFAETERW